MASIKFNEDIIELDNYDDNNIYDLNIFINENFNFIRDNPNFYQSINIDKFNYTSYTCHTDNYKKMYKNYIYINKLNNYNIKILGKIYNTSNILINRNEDNIINNISLHYKNNHITTFHNYLYDIESKNIDIRLINQYLYYMNIYFSNKYKNLENQFKTYKNKIKLIENNLINLKNQETDINYLKYKINIQEDKINILENKINNLNNQLFYLFSLSLLFLINIFKNIFM